MVVAGLVLALLGLIFLITHVVAGLAIPLLVIGVVIALVGYFVGNRGGRRWY